MNRTERRRAARITNKAVEAYDRNGCSCCGATHDFGFIFVTPEGKCLCARCGPSRQTPNTQTFAMAAFQESPGKVDDARYFSANPDAEFRIRAIYEGEAEELFIGNDVAARMIGRSGINPAVAEAFATADHILTYQFEPGARARIPMRLAGLSELETRETIATARQFAINNSSVVERHRRLTPEARFHIEHAATFTALEEASGETAFSDYIEAMGAATREASGATKQ